MSKVSQEMKEQILWELEESKKIKKEFTEKGTKMSIILRREKYSGMSIPKKAYLLRWSGESDSMMVDENGNIVLRKG